MFCTQNNVFEVLCSFGLEILRLRQDIKNPDILAYFGIFLRRINGKYQAKTDSSPSEDALKSGLLLLVYLVPRRANSE